MKTEIKEGANLSNSAYITSMAIVNYVGKRVLLIL